MHRDTSTPYLGYELYRKELYKGIKIHITTNGKVRVTAAFNIPTTHINNFVAQKQDWILKAQAKLNTYFALTPIKKQYLSTFPYVTLIKEEAYICPKALLKAAKEISPSVVGDLAHRCNLKYTAVSFRNNTRVWGSCTASNKINLNTKLMLLPNHLLLYVLYHELAHIKYKNHGPSFWRYLETFCPNAKILAKEMRNFGYLLNLKAI